MTARELPRRAAFAGRQRPVHCDATADVLERYINALKRWEGLVGPPRPMYCEATADMIARHINGVDERGRA